MDTSAQGSVIGYEMVGDPGDKIVDAQLFGGHQYKGPISMDGIASYKWNDGLSFEGDFQNGKLTGFGVYKFKNGIYDGHVYEGTRHGFGTLILFGAKTKYVGEWRNGKRHGKGIIHYNYDHIEHSNSTQSTPTDTYYDGDWVNGKREGHGVCVYRDGDRYEGEWKGDRKNGKGIMHWTMSKEIYYGEWKDDEPDGMGIHLMANKPNKQNSNQNSITFDQFTVAHLEGSHNFTTFVGKNWYYGEWTAGKREGFGIFNYSNGAKYEGQWRNNKKHGKGDYIYENGTRFVGEFVNDIQKYDSKEHSEATMHRMSQRFVFDESVLDDLLLDKENIDIAEMTKNILRNWKPITTTFSKIQKLQSLWMIVELLQFREIHSIYDVNAEIVSFTTYPGKVCNITDPQHQFLLREFHRMLLKLCFLTQKDMEEFLEHMIFLAPRIEDLSLTNFFWKNFPSTYEDSWITAETQNAFDENFKRIIPGMTTKEDVSENVTAEYVKGSALRSVLEQMVEDPILQSMILTQFEKCYHSQEEYPVMVEECPCDLDLDSIRLLVHESKMWFMVMITVRVSYRTMMDEVERIRKEKEQQALEEKAHKGKSKKGKKGKKQEEEEHDEDAEQGQIEMPNELEFIEILPEHVQEFFDQFTSMNDE